MGLPDPISIDQIELLAREKNPLVRGILDKDSLAVIFAQPGSYKTFVSIDLALRISTGMDVWDKGTIQGPVLYYIGEAQRPFCRRVLGWRDQHPRQCEKLAANFRIVTQVPNLTDRRDIDRLIEQGRTHKPKLIVIDTLALAIPGVDENSSGHLGVAIEALREIRDRVQCAVLVVHHTDKSGMTERGSSALRGAADTMFRLSRDDDDEYLVRVRIDKTRESGLGQEYPLKLVPVQLPGRDNLGEPLGTTLICHYEKNPGVPNPPRPPELPAPEPSRSTSPQSRGTSQSGSRRTG